jgi:hypothetical protein
VSYDAIENHDNLIAWSRRYCERAIRVHGLGVALDAVEWTVSTRARRRAAAVRHPVIEDAATGRPYEWDDGPPTCTVALTWPAFEAFSREEWRSTLRHELVHVEQFQRTGTTGHGPGFSERAVVVDAVESCPSFAEPNYLLHCSDCEDVVASRFRASRLVEEPGAYRSECCEAPLSVKSS